MTPKQRQLYDFLVREWRQKGYGPSYDEMMFALGTKSKGSVHRIARTLIANGYATQGKSKNRSLRPVLDTDEVFRLALLAIASGTQDPVAVAKAALKEVQ